VRLDENASSCFVNDELVDRVRTRRTSLRGGGAGEVSRHRGRLQERFKVAKEIPSSTSFERGSRADSRRSPETTEDRTARRIRSWSTQLLLPQADATTLAAGRRSARVGRAGKAAETTGNRACTSRAFASVGQTGGRAQTRKRRKSIWFARPCYIACHRQRRSRRGGLSRGRSTGWFPRSKLSGELRERGRRSGAAGGARTSSCSTQMGFHGSRTNYYSKSNSYLNEVLDDREGLPISALGAVHADTGAANRPERRRRRSCRDTSSCGTSRGWANGS
jgi:hypothetical protein